LGAGDDVDVGPGFGGDRVYENSSLDCSCVD
jgi:hypothetical protein